MRRRSRSGGQGLLWIWAFIFALLTLLFFFRSARLSDSLRVLSTLRHHSDRDPLQQTVPGLEATGSNPCAKLVGAARDGCLAQAVQPQHPHSADDQGQVQAATRQLIVPGEIAATDDSVEEESGLEPLFLFVGVLSGRGYRHRRLAVREAWANRAQNPPSSLVKFILSEDERTPQVQKELDTHSDIVFVKEKTNYKSILYKTYYVLEWAVLKYDVNFVLKTDDDAFVNVPPMVEMLKGLCESDDCRHERLYLGRMAKSSEVLLQPGHKWNNIVFHNHTGLKTYPNYMMGGGYVVSGDVARTLVEINNRMRLKFTPIEDATLGFWLMAMDLRHVDHQRFHTWALPCCFRPPVRREGQRIVTRFQLSDDFEKDLCSDNPWLILHKIDSPTKMRYIGHRVVNCTKPSPVASANDPSGRKAGAEDTATDGVQIGDAGVQGSDNGGAVKATGAVQAAIAGDGADAGGKPSDAQPQQLFAQLLKEVPAVNAAGGTALNAAAGVDAADSAATDVTISDGAAGGTVANAQAAAAADMANAADRAAGAVVADAAVNADSAAGGAAGTADAGDVVVVAADAAAAGVVAADASDGQAAMAADAAATDGAVDGTAAATDAATAAADAAQQAALLGAVGGAVAAGAAVDAAGGAATAAARR